MAKLTPKGIRAAPAGRWLPDDARRGTGVLVLYVTGPGNGIWYFRYTTITGRRDTLPLLYPHGACEYHEAGDGEATYSLKQARDLADKHRAVYLAGNRDLRAYYDHQIAQAAAAEKAALESQHQAEADAAAAAARRDKHSVKALLAAYVGHLERRGKPAARDARNIFRRNVEDAFPDLATRPAAEITASELRGVLARLVEAGKGRTAGKLRSYLSAAFQLALRAENDPAAPTGLSDFEIVANPCDRIPSLSEFNRTRDRALSWPELIAYRKAVEALPRGATRDCLLAALLLGGQRLAQLARVTRDDLTVGDGESDATITLRDPKGARKHPRLHVLPLQGRALALVKRRLSALDAAKAAAEAKAARKAARKRTPEAADLAKRTCGLLFSHDYRSSVRVETLSNAVGGLSTTLLESKDVTAPFRLSDIRRTAETLLAGLGVSSDVRAQLQSHGLGGIQTRHYDRHSYMAEKRAALALWESQLYRRKVANGSAAATKRQRAKKP